ncbi:polysaccharide biosynthesis protein [Ammoniphilus sp. CFH 90114]|uniref:putative polysaccharide biosynthesis protein n=1 Tax=Ammoniphilus sp. CFH 90114 TaxID=2493665 RepID=UPI00100DDB07|nr:polysaccharide biosynthesis protein [Ammoniphilus sp. CFH 90114]RXT03691.1 polysaccharide biosynthesis protein [Ammoniphilus sp. CFH 90114]
MSKNALIRGTIILTIAALITRVMGVAQRIPLQRILEDEGMATYGIAYNIYGILLIIATVGIPSALSKQIAEYHALGQFHEAQQTYQASRTFSIFAGVAAAVLLYAAAPFYAIHISHDPEAILAIRAIAPALLLFPLISIMRGYFQGLQFMSPTGLSQISEQFLRVGVAVILPLYLLSVGFSREVAVAGASFGAVAGSFGAIAVMIYFTYKTKQKREEEQRAQAKYETLSRNQIYRKLLKTAIPISLASTAIPFIYFIDSSTVISLLKPSMGFEEAKATLGILVGRAQALAAIPPILAIALSSAVLPAVASAYSNKDLKQVSQMGSLSLRLTLLTGAPLALYLTAAAFAVNGFLFGDIEGSWVVAALCFGSIFQMLMMTSMAILQGLGKTTLPMWHVFAAIVVKGLLNIVLAPWIGIYGVILATTISFLIILFLNLRAIQQLVPLQILSERWRGFLWSSVALVASVWPIYMGLEAWITIDWPVFVRYGLICLATALVGFPVYFGLLLLLGGMNAEDLSFLPGRVRKILGRVLRKKEQELEKKVNDL